MKLQAQPLLQARQVERQSAEAATLMSRAEMRTRSVLGGMGGYWGLRCRHAACSVGRERCHGLRCLAAAPDASGCTCNCYRQPRWPPAAHFAAIGGHAAAIQLLLAAVPQAGTASAANQYGCLLLHCAAAHADESTVIEVLFAAAPGSEQHQLMEEHVG